MLVFLGLNRVLWLCWRTSLFLELHAEISRGEVYDPEKYKPHTPHREANTAKRKPLLNPRWRVTPAEFFPFFCTLNTFLIKSQGRKVLIVQFEEPRDLGQSP